VWRSVWELDLRVCLLGEVLPGPDDPCVTVRFRLERNGRRYQLRNVEPVRFPGAREDGRDKWVQLQSLTGAPVFWEIPLRPDGSIVWLMQGGWRWPVDRWEIRRLQTLARR
jgi:hypothetical protein